MFAFSSCRQSTSGFSRSRNSHTCAARARMPFTFQVAIFIGFGDGARINSGSVPDLRAFDDLELVVDAADAVDFAGELRGAAALGVARDGAPQGDLAIGSGNVDRTGGQLGAG